MNDGAALLAAAVVAAVAGILTNILTNAFRRGSTDAEAATNWTTSLSKLREDHEDERAARRADNLRFENQIVELRADYEQQLAEVKADYDKQIAEMKEELTKWKEENHQLLIENRALRNKRS